MYEMSGKQKKDYLRVGDIICLTYNQKVFEGDLIMKKD